MADSIRVENLVKKFTVFTAVDKISFSVKRGELFGLLGPNGAGKTTTINMLSTLIRPTSGKAYIDGHDISRNKDAVRNSIGVVFQDPALDGQLTGEENLYFHAMVYGLKKEERNERISEVLDLVELKDKANMLVEKYSGGMKRRLEIARGLIHRPKVLFLDEPTLGLDTQTRRHIWDYIKKLNKDSKVTVILTTHYMEEADFLCDRIAIIDKGKIVAMDTPRRLKDVLGGDVIRLEVDSSKSQKLVSKLQGLDWVRTVRKYNGNVAMTTSHGETRIPEIIEIAQNIKVKIHSVYLHKPSLEDVFLHFTGRTIRDNESSSSDVHKIIRRQR